MTATPISTGTENLQAILDMVEPDAKRLESIEEVADRGAIVNVSLGQVLRDFGIPQGEHIGLHFNDELRFFPKLDLRTVLYASDMDDVFQALANMDFTVDGQAGESGELADDDEEATLEGRHGFIRALIARRAESSAPAFLATVGRLAAAVQQGRIHPRDSTRFMSQLEILEVLGTTVSRRPDRKLKELVKQVRKLAPGVKAIVFTEYRTTAEMIFDILRTSLGGRRVALVTGEFDAVARKRIFEAFSPLAQRVKRIPHEVYDVLVATDAISEGENLQDAEAVFNYDISWTPLRLIQRVGRVNRFTEDKRTIRVRNFFPGTEHYETIVRLHSRLTERGQEVAQLSDVDYIRDGVQTPAWLAERNCAAVAQLYSDAPTWTEVSARADAVPATPVCARLWGASPAKLEQARELPDGVQAFAFGRRAGLYVLLNVDGERVALFCDEQPGSMLIAPKASSHEEILAILLDLKQAHPSMDEVALDQQIDAVVREWRAGHQAGEDAEIMVVAAIHVRAQSPMDPGSTH